MKNISTIMTVSPVVANPSNKLSQVLRLFTEFPVHHLPIVDDDNKLIGILSTNDLPKVFLALANKPEPKPLTLALIDDEIKITDLMTPNPITISSGDSISKAAEIFASKRFMALPVVDNGTLIGIVSLKDVIGYLNYLTAEA